MEPASRWKLQVQDGDHRQETQKPRVDSNRTQDLARQEDVDRESRSLVTAEHQRAHHRCDHEVDERVPGLVAAEVEPARSGKQRQEMKRRTVSSTMFSSQSPAGRRIPSLVSTSIVASLRQMDQLLTGGGSGVEFAGNRNFLRRQSVSIVGKVASITTRER